MTVAFRAAGTSIGANTAVTAINPDVPASAITGDLSVLNVVVKPFDATISTPTGWTKIFEQTNGTIASSADIGSVRHYIFVRESAPTGPIGNLAQTNANSITAGIVTYQKTLSTWDYSAVTYGVDTTNDANFSATAIAGLNVASGDYVVCGFGINSDGGAISSQSFDGMSGATLGSIGYRFNQGTATGNDTRLIVLDRAVSSGSPNAVPDAVYTNTASTSGIAAFLRLRDVSIQLQGTPTLAEGDGTATSITIPYPSGIIAGEFLLANITFSQEYINNIPPSGWSLLIDHQNGPPGNTVSGVMYYRWATGTETGSETFTVTAPPLNEDGRTTGRMSRWSNVNTSTPLDVSGVFGSSANATTLDMPSITTVTPGAILIHQLSQNSTTAVISTLSGTTKYGNSITGTGRTQETFYELKPTAGATGTRTWSSNTSVQWGGITVALRPATGPSTPNATLTGSGILTATGTQTGVTPTLVHRIVGVPGTTSSTVSVRVSNASTLRLKASTDSAGTTGVVWGSPVTPSGLGDAKLPITGLTPGTHYYYRVAMTNGGTEYLDTHATIGRLRTAPSGQANFAFNFSSCSTQDNPASMATIAARNDDLFFHLGDFYYADGSGTGIDNFRTKFNTKITSTNHAAVFATVPSNYTPSDHDGMNNNGSAGNDPTAWDNWRTVYEEVFPAPALYYSFMYGRVLFIQINDRSFKSATAATDNSSKTALGATQKQWLKDQITNTTAKAIVIAQPSPWIAAAETGGDGWAGFTTERTELANFFAASGKPIVMLGGDMHALAADDGTNAPGGITMFHAAPFYNAASHKGGPYTVSPYPGTTGANVSQYGRCVVTDTGTQISFAYTGYSSDNTARVTLTKNFSVTAEASISLTGAGTLTAVGTVVSVTKIKQWSGDGLSAGAFTTAGSVGTGDTAFDGTYGTAGDITIVNSGTRSPRLQVSGATSASGVHWDFGTELVNYSVRTYLEFTNYSTSASATILNALSAGGSTIRWRFDLSTTGAIRFRGAAAAAIWSPADILEVNTNYRIEILVTGTLLDIYIYNGDSMTIVASTTGLTVGSGLGRLRFGDNTSDAIDGKKYDDMAVGNAAVLLGPETSGTVAHTGSASLTGSGTLTSAPITVGRTGSASLTGSGTLTVVGTVPTILSKAETLKFNNWATTANNSLFTPYDSTRRIINNNLEIDAASNYPQILSVNKYDLRNSYISAKFISFPNISNGSTEAHFGISVDSANQASFGWVNGSIFARVRTSNVDNNTTYTTYNESTHRNLRIREASGVLYWETSADGITWSNFYNTTPAFSVASVDLRLFAGNWNSASSPGFVTYGSINLFQGTNKLVHFGVATTNGPSTQAEIDEVISLTGRNPKFELWYTSWAENKFTATNLNKASDRNAINYITWEPFDGTGPVNSAYSYTNILAGNFDTVIDNTATAIKNYGKPVYLRPFHEMNGDWYPWCIGQNGNTAEQHKQVWNYVKNRFTNIGTTNVIWVWSPNVNYSGSADISAIYPGDINVDIIAVDGYNWGTTNGKTWITPSNLFDSTFNQIRAIAPTKTLWIGETGSAEEGGDKALWIKQLFSWITSQENLKTLIWFNLNKEADWRINSSTASTSAFSDSITLLSTPIYYINGINLTGSGTLTTTAGTVNRTGSAAFTGSGTLTATTGNVLVTSPTLLTGTGLLTSGGNGGTSFTQSVNVSGAGSLTSSVTGLLVVRAIALTGSGTLGTQSGVSGTGSASLSGSGTLSTIVGAVNRTGSAILTGSGTLTAAGSIDPAYISGWGLPSWRDEFEGSVVDTNKWVIRDDSTHGNLSYDWTVIDNTTNTVSIVNNQLRIRANKLDTPVVSGGKTRYWTTGYLDTIGKMTKTYGRWEIRAQLPTVRNTSQGLWPAFWLRNGSVGEIDILESWGDPPRNRARAANLSETSTFTMHESTNGGGASQGWTYEHRANPSHSSSSVYNTAQGMHTWALEYTPTYLKAIFDGTTVVHIVPTGELISGTTVDYSWVWGPNFTSPWNIRLNLQVGDPYWSSFDTAPSDSLTAMPADYTVDYVRVWDYTEPPPPPPPPTVTKIRQWSGNGLSAGAFTASGSVGTGDTAFDGTYGTAGDITIVNSGTRSPRLQVSGATSASGVHWDFGIPLTNYSFRTYFEYSGYSTSSSGSIFGALSSDFTSILWRFDISTVGAVRFRGAGATPIWSPATTLELNTVYRIEGIVSDTTLDLYIYEGDSTTVYASVLGLTVGSGLGRIRFGDSISDTVDGKKYDDMAVGDAAVLLGPAITGTAFTGSASLTGSGTLTSAPITVGRTGSASLTGSGTLTVQTSTAVPVNVSLTGSGALTTAVGTVTRTGTASFTGSGTLIAVAGTVGRTGSANFTGLGVLTSIASGLIIIRAVPLSGSGTLGTQSGVSGTGSASLSGSGTLSTIVGAVNRTGSITLSGSGQLTAVANVVTTTRTVILTGSGTLSSVVVVVTAGAVSLTGSGILSSVTVPSTSRTTALTGSGILTLNAAGITLTGTAALSGLGTLSPAATGMSHSRVVNLTGTGTLAPSTSTSGATSTNLSGAGTLSITVGTVNRTGSASLTGSGTLSNSAVISASRSASFIGAGILTSASTPFVITTCSLTGSGALTASTNSSSTGNATLTGSGSLSTAVNTSIIQVSTFTGLGTLNAIANAITQQVSAVFTSTGTLNTQTAGSGSGTANLNSSGDLTSSTQIQILRSAGFTGSGTLSSTSIIALITQVNLTGSGTLSATGQQIIARTIGLTGSGTLTTSATPKAIRNVSVTGSGILTTSVAGLSTVRTVELTGTGTLTAVSTNVHQAVSTNFTGTGVIGFQTGTSGTGNVNLSGTGTLSAIGITKTIQNAALNGSNTLSTNTNLSVSVTSTFNSSGILTLETELALNRITVLTGSGTLTTVRNISTNIETNFSGGSTLTVNTVVNPRIIPGTLELLTIKMNPRQYNGYISSNRFRV